MQAENSFAEGSLPTKLKTKMAFDGNDILLVKKKSAPGKDGPTKVTQDMIMTCEFLSM
jgi:transcription initiation factor TFIID subunit 1